MATTLSPKALTSLLQVYEDLSIAFENLLRERHEAVTILSCTYGGKKEDGVFVTRQRGSLLSDFSIYGEVTSLLFHEEEDRVTASFSAFHPTTQDGEWLQVEVPRAVLEDALGRMNILWDTLPASILPA